MKITQLIDILVPFDKGISAISTVGNLPDIEAFCVSGGFDRFGTTLKRRQERGDILGLVASSGDARTSTSSILKHAQNSYRNRNPNVLLNPFPVSYGVIPTWLPALPQTDLMTSSYCGFVPFLKQHTAFGQDLSVIELVIRGMTLRRGSFARKNIQRRLIFILMVIELAQKFDQREIRLLDANMDTECISWTLLYFFLEKYFPKDIKNLKYRFLERYSAWKDRDAPLTEIDEQLEIALPYYMIIVFKAIFSGNPDRLLKCDSLQRELHRSVFDIANSLTSRFSEGLELFSEQAADIIDSVHHKYNDLFPELFLTHISICDLHKIGMKIIIHSEEAK